MSYAISGECCSDASCVAVCPMNSIHPAPGEPGFGTGASLFIDGHQTLIVQLTKGHLDRPLVATKMA